LQITHRTQTFGDAAIRANRFYDIMRQKVGEEGEEDWSRESDQKEGERMCIGVGENEKRSECFVQVSPAHNIRVHT
jgi:hypothetical protein